MHSARLVALVLSTVALVTAQQDISGTIHKTATTTRYLTIVRCGSGLASCPSSGPTSQSTPIPAPQVTSAEPSVDSTATAPSTETEAFTSASEAPSAETTSTAAPQSSSFAPPASWYISNSTTSAAPSGTAASVPTEPSADAPPTVASGAANGFQPGPVVAAAAAMVAALVAVV